MRMLMYFGASAMIVGGLGLALKAHIPFGLLIAGVGLGLLIGAIKAGR